MRVSVIKSVVIILALLAVSATATISAFSLQDTIAGNSFTTGNPNLLFLLNANGAPDPENLTPVLNGMSFTGIVDGWQQDVGIKLANVGDIPLNVWLKAQSQTSDFQRISHSIFINVYYWIDNGDGIVTAEEIGNEYGTRKSLAYWTTDPFPFGVVSPGSLLPVVIRFSAPHLDNVQQGASIVMDFIFDASSAGF